MHVFLLLLICIFLILAENTRFMAFLLRKADQNGLFKNMTNTMRLTLSSSQNIRQQRGISSSSICRIAGDNEESPARAHRKESPTTSGGPDVDTLTGQAKDSSTAKKIETSRKSAEGLADLTQKIASSTENQNQMPRRPRINTDVLAPQQIRTTTDDQSAVTYAQIPPLAPSGYSLTNVPLRSDPILNALINNLMKDGKKATATRHILDMLDHMAKAMHANPLPAVEEAIRIASPLVRLQTRKQGGKNLQVPIVLFSNQSRRRGIIAIIEASKKRNDNKLSLRLAKEMIAVLEGNSAALTRKLEVHRLATVNRSNTGVRV